MTDGVHGYVPAPEAGEENKFLKGDGSWGNVPDPQTMSGATSSAAGTGGLVPTPTAGSNVLFLRGDATWANPPGSKLIVKELDNVSNTSGSYSHTTTLSDMAADMKAVMLELSNPAAFLDTINITTADGSITLSCSSVAGSSTVKVGLLFIANSGAITSSEFDVLNNRLQAVENVCTATDVTIATTDWTLANGVYSYVWSNSLVQAGSLINITLRDGAENAGIDEFEFTHTTGSVTIATSSVPTASLPITINVIHTKPNGLQELSADQISSEAVTGCDTVEEALTAINDKIVNKTVSVTPNSSYVKNDSVMTFVRTGNILKVNGYINTASAVPAYSKLYDIADITGIGANMYAWCGTIKIYLSSDGTQIKNETALTGSATYVVDATFIVA